MLIDCQQCFQGSKPNSSPLGGGLQRSVAVRHGFKRRLRILGCWEAVVGTGWVVAIGFPRPDSAAKPLIQYQLAKVSRRTGEMCRVHTHLQGMPYPGGAKCHHRSTNDYNDLDPHLSTQYHASAYSWVRVCQNSEPTSVTFGCLPCIQIALADHNNEVVNRQNGPKSVNARKFRQGNTSEIAHCRL